MIGFGTTPLPHWQRHPKPIMTTAMIQAVVLCL